MTRALAIAAAAIVLFASSAAAQNRSGAWVGFGGGYGSAGVSCDDCDSEREDSGIGYVRGGWNANPKVRLGAEFILWRKSFTVEDVKATFNIYNVMGIASFYPGEASGLFVRAGAGAGLVDAQFNASNMSASLDTAAGFGAIAGAGYDARISKHVSITLAGDVWFGAPGDLMTGGRVTQRNFKHNVVDFTVGLTFR